MHGDHRDGVHQGGVGWGCHRWVGIVRWLCWICIISILPLKCLHFFCCILPLGSYIPGETKINISHLLLLDLASISYRYVQRVTSFRSHFRGSFPSFHRMKPTRSIATPPGWDASPSLPSSCTAFSQAFTVNSFRWRIRDERPYFFAQTTWPKTDWPQRNIEAWELVHHRLLLPSILSPVPIYTPGWRERHCES